MKLWLLTFLLALPQLAHAQCTVEQARAIVATRGDWASCVDADLKGSHAGRVLTDAASTQELIAHHLRTLATEMRASTLPPMLAEAWAMRIEAQLPLEGASEALSAASFAQTGTLLDRACGCQWSIGVQAPGETLVCVGPSQPQSACPSPSPYTHRVSASEAVRAFSLAYLAHRGMTALNADAQERVVLRLRKAKRRWSGLLARGYTQFPWELAVNSKIGDRRERSRCAAGHDAACETASLEPDPTQLILLHPSPGLGFRGLGLKQVDMSAKAVLLLNVEALGFLHYTRDFQQYYGLGVSVSVADLDFGRPLVGAIVHVTRWIHVGYAVSVAQRSLDGTVFVAADLFGTLSKWMDTGT